MYYVSWSRWLDGEDNANEEKEKPKVKKKPLVDKVKEVNVTPKPQRTRTYTEDRGCGGTNGCYEDIWEVTEDLDTGKIISESCIRSGNVRYCK